VRRLSADRDYEVELLSRRREGIDHELALERRRRETELRAREDEIEARLAQLRLQLADATRLQRERETLELAERRQQHGRAMAQSARQQRDQHIADLQSALDKTREQIAAQRARADELHQDRAANTEALVGTRGRLDTLNERITGRHAQMRELRDLLPPDAATGPWGWLALGDSVDASVRRNRRQARRSLRRLEQETAEDQRQRDSLRGHLAVLELEQQRLDVAAADLRAEIDQARQRRDDLRRRIDGLLLQPLEPVADAARAEQAGGTDTPADDDGGPRIRSV
jgi:chromosome segregation ATPase